MVERLRDWAKVAEQEEFTLAIKAHVGGALHTPEGADWLFRQINSPWIKLAYDYSHYQAQGMEMKPSLELLLPNSVFIHIKDNQGKNGQVQFALPGEAPRMTVRPPGSPKIFTPEPVLQTVRIDAERRTVSLAWCGAVRLMAPLGEEQIEETKLGVTWGR